MWVWLGDEATYIHMIHNTWIQATQPRRCWGKQSQCSISARAAGQQDQRIREKGFFLGPAASHIPL